MTAREEIEAMLAADPMVKSWTLAKIALVLADRIDRLDILTHGGRSAEEYIMTLDKAGRRR